MKFNNSQNPAYFQFTLFADYGPLRYLFFTVCLLIYAIIICVNVVIFLTIILEKSLHQPMYIFVCCLSVNSLYGTAGFFPRFLMDILSDTHFISRSSCFTQIYVIYTYASCEFTILGIMAYDRFVAICQPLHYHTKMTIRRTLCLWAVAVFFPVFAIAYIVVLATQLPLCDYKLPRLFCTNRAVVRHSCIETTHIDIVGHFIGFSTILVPLFVVLYTYVHILIVCKKGTIEQRRRALQTCLPHLVTFVTYTCSMALVAFDTENINPIVMAVLSLEYLIVPSINNPLIYGLKLPQIRAVLAKRFKISLNCKTQERILQK